jgi:hypothetical protein
MAKEETVTLRLANSYFFPFSSSLFSFWFFLLALPRANRLHISVGIGDIELGLNS